MSKIISVILKIILFFILLFIIIFGILYGILSYTLKKEYPKDKIKKIVEEKRNEIDYTKLKNVDEKYLKALIATEDHRFYDHDGIDKISLLRAIRVNLKNKRIIEGGSTITQQLIKNLILSQDKSINRKIKEAYLTIQFEKMYTKNEILELYINTSYFGSGYYNILEASLGYFGKMPNDLTQIESVFLAGVPNAPSIYDPRVNEEKAEQRKNQVLSKMTDNNVITKDEAIKLSKEKIKVLDKDDTDKLIENIKNVKKNGEKNESTK